MLKEIKDALSTLGLPVFYGMAQTIDGADLWDYIVFYRTSITPSATKRGRTEAFTVALVQEEYVDDERLTQLVKAVESVKGVSRAMAGISFEYMVKPATNTVLEAALVTFVRPSKVCPNG